MWIFLELDLKISRPFHRTSFQTRQTLTMTRTDAVATEMASKETTKAVIHAPVGKDGEGAYSASTKGCMDVIQLATPLILDQVKVQSIQPGRPFHVADYGTADAGTSLGLLSAIVKAVRGREAGKEVVLHYEDQRGNEWKSVFNHVLGINKVTDAYGKEMQTPYALGNVFVEACGVSFHSQCYPTKSIDLGNAICVTRSIRVDVVSKSRITHV